VRLTPKVGPDATQLTLFSSTVSKFSNNGRSKSYCANRWGPYITHVAQFEQ